MMLPHDCKPIIEGVFERFLTDYSFVADAKRFGFAVWLTNSETGETNSIETYRQNEDGTYNVVLWTPECAEESDAKLLGKLTHLEHDEDGLYLCFEKDGKHYRVDSEGQRGDPLTVCEEYDTEVLA